MNVYGETPFLGIRILPIDSHCREEGECSPGLLEDWLFSPVSLPKASLTDKEDKLGPWLARLGRARDSVVAVANDLAVPGYMRPELADIAVGLNGARLKLEQMYRRPAWVALAVEENRRIRRGASERRSKSKITIKSKKGGTS